jgi:sn-glycerol 3-phosphate transport system substrate-binding protein
MTAVLGSSGVQGSTSRIGISVWLERPYVPPLPPRARQLSRPPTSPGDYDTASQPEIGVAAASAFNQAHPDYVVEVKSFDFHTMPAMVAQAAEQGAPPDVAELYCSVTRPALDTLGPDGSPLFTPVERAIAGRAEVLGEPVMLGDMVPAARDYFRYAGELASMPRIASTPLLYANMSILAKAGVAEPPRTWREVRAACRAVARLPGRPAHGISWANCYWWFLQSVAQQGGLIADRDNGRSGRAENISLASSEMMAYVTWWQRLHRDGYYLYTGKAWDFDGCFAAFENQQVALVVSSSVDAAHLLRRGERHGFTVKASPMPYNDEVALAGNMMGGSSLWLAAGLSKAKQDGALAFMQYLISPSNAAEMAKRHHRIPITGAAAEVLDREGWFRRNPNVRVAREQLEAADGSPAALGPLLGGFADIAGEITGAMHDVLVGDAEPVARFARASERAQRMLDAYNADCAGPPRRTPRDLAIAL